MSCFLCLSPQTPRLGQSFQLDALFLHLSGGNLTHPSKVIWNTLSSVKLFLTPSTRKDFSLLWAHISMVLYMYPSQGNYFLPFSLKGFFFFFWFWFYYCFVYVSWLSFWRQSVSLNYFSIPLFACHMGVLYKDVWFNQIFIEWMDG